MDGQLLLMDAGCERHGYASDVTRCWPVNGRFSPEQAAVYQIVQEVHRRAPLGCLPFSDLVWLYLHAVCCMSWVFSVLRKLYSTHTGCNTSILFCAVYKGRFK